MKYTTMNRDGRECFGLTLREARQTAQDSADTTGNTTHIYTMPGELARRKAGLDGSVTGFSRKPFETVTPNTKLCRDGGASDL